MLKFLNYIGTSRDIIRRTNNVARSMVFLTGLFLLLLLTWSWPIPRIVSIVLLSITALSVLIEVLNNLMVSRKIDIYHRPNYARIAIVTLLLLAIFGFTAVNYRSVISDRISEFNFVRANGAFQRTLSTSPFAADALLESYCAQHPLVITPAQKEKCDLRISRCVESILDSVVNVHVGNGSYGIADTIVGGYSDSVNGLHSEQSRRALALAIEERVQGIRRRHTTYCISRIDAALSNRDLSTAYRFIDESGDESAYNHLPRSTVEEKLRAACTQEFETLKSDVDASLASFDFDGASGKVSAVLASCSIQVAGIDVFSFSNASDRGRELNQLVAEAREKKLMEDMMASLGGYYSKILGAVQVNDFVRAANHVSEFEIENKGIGEDKAESLRVWIAGRAKYYYYKKFYMSRTMADLYDFEENGTLYDISPDEQRLFAAYRQYLLVQREMRAYHVNIKTATVSSSGDRTYEGVFSIEIVDRYGQGSRQEECSRKVSLRREQRAWQSDIQVTSSFESTMLPTDIDLPRLKFVLDAKRVPQFTMKRSEKSVTLSMLDKSNGTIFFTDNDLGLTVSVSYSMPGVEPNPEPFLEAPDSPSPAPF